MSQQHAVGGAYIPPPGVLSCSRCGFRAASERNMIRAGFGLQCPRCRAIVSRDTLTGADVATADPNPYVSATFLGIVTPDDVGAEKRSIEPYVEETNIKAELNKNKVPADLSKMWADFYVSWKDFYSSPTFLPTAGLSYKKALEYRAKLHGLQLALNPYFSERATIVPMPNLTPPGAATDPGPAGQPQTVWDRLTTASDKWSNVALATLVIGGGLAAWLIYQQAKNADRMADRVLPHFFGG